MTINPALLGGFLRAARDSDGPSEHRLEDGSWIVVKPGAAPGELRIVEQQDPERNVTMTMTFLAPDVAGGSRPASWPHVEGHQMVEVVTDGEVLLLWPEGDEGLHARVVSDMEARGWKEDGSESTATMGRTAMVNEGRRANVNRVHAGPVNMVTVDGLSLD